MRELSFSEISEVSAGASKTTIAKSAARIIAKNIARGFLVGSGVGTLAAFAWFVYDAIEYSNR